MQLNTEPIQQYCITACALEPTEGSARGGRMIGHLSDSQQQCHKILLGYWTCDSAYSRPSYFSCSETCFIFKLADR